MQRKRDKPILREDVFLIGWKELKEYPAEEVPPPRKVSADPDQENSGSRLEFPARTENAEAAEERLGMEKSFDERTLENAARDVHGRRNARRKTQEYGRELLCQESEGVRVEGKEDRFESGGVPEVKECFFCSVLSVETQFLLKAINGSLGKV